MDITVGKDVVLRNVTDDDKRLVKESLTILNPAWQDAVQFNRSTWGIKKTIKLYEEVGNTLIIPRGSLYKLINLTGIPNSISYDVASFKNTEVPTNIKLRKLQQPWVQSMLMHKQGIGVAPAGSGKTVMALQVIASIGQPTLWLTHRQSLVKQLKDRAGFFYGDAGKIGTIGVGKFEIGDFLTVGMVQTIAKKDMQELVKQFGVVFVDECHIVPAAQTMASVRQFAPEYLYGLTATPYREDRLEQIMFDTIGPVIAHMDRETVVEEKGILPATVVTRYTGISYPTSRPGAKDFSKVIDYLVNHTGRNNMIVMDILTEIGLGNICIALTSRVDHGLLLKEMLAKYGVECEHLHSKQTRKQREERLGRFLDGEVPLLIATYQLLSEGFDHQPTNRIFFTLPYKSKGLIEQSKGRIERTSPGKTDALVLDYVDNIPMLLNQYDKRCEQYEDHNLDIVSDRF